jgi:hypothetical protein
MSTYRSLLAFKKNTAKLKKGPWRGGLKRGRKGHTMLYTNYSIDGATYAANIRRRHRMSKDEFMKIIHGVRKYDKYFKLKHDIINTP